MNKALISMALVVTGVLFSASSVAKNIRVAGRVVKSSGDPIADAVVTIENSGNVVATAHADRAGNFAFASIPPNRYDLVISAHNFWPVTRSLDTSGGSNADIGIVQLQVKSFIAVLHPPQTGELENVFGPPQRLCELVADPSSFNGAVVTVRAKVHVAFEDFELPAKACEGKIDGVWLEYGRGPKKQPAIWCCGDTTPRETGITLDQNAEFKRFHHYVTARFRGKSCYQGECPAYDVTATLTGRFDAVQTAICRDGKSQCPQQGGFGHLGQFPARIVIQSISDVSAVPISPSR